MGLPILSKLGRAFNALTSAKVNATNAFRGAVGLPPNTATKKYELLDESVSIPEGTTTVYRIRALRDIPAHGVKKGDLGGFVACPENLSQEGDAWVGDNSWVCGRNVRISGNALIGGEAVICDNVKISDDARVVGTDIRISDNVRLSGNVEVGSKTKLSEFVELKTGQYSNVTLHRTPEGLEDKATIVTTGGPSLTAEAA